MDNNNNKKPQSDIKVIDFFNKVMFPTKCTNRVIDLYNNNDIIFLERLTREATTYGI